MHRQRDGDAGHCPFLQKFFAVLTQDATTNGQAPSSLNALNATGCQSNGSYISPAVGPGPGAISSYGSDTSSSIEQSNGCGADGHSTGGAGCRMLDAVADGRTNKCGGAHHVGAGGTGGRLAFGGGHDKSSLRWGKDGAMKTHLFMASRPTYSLTDRPAD